jgi:hypothetical protein
MSRFPLISAVAVLVLGLSAGLGFAQQYINPASITATASSVNYQLEPIYSCNGNGLTGDLHTNNIGGEPPAAGQGTMWLAEGPTIDPAPWIRYQFDRIYTVNTMWVWNYNQVTPSGGDRTNRGINQCTIEYSTDGTTYTQLGTTHTFARADASASYAHNTEIDFGGVAARYVRINAISNHGGSSSGLSEVRFYAGNSIGFAQASSSGVEAATPVNLDVIMTTASASTVTISYAANGGSAVNGSDYDLAAGVLTFNPGDTVETISIPITQDGIDENDETIVVTLSNLTGGTDIQLELGTTQHTYTILDPRPTVQFAAAASGGSEDTSPAIVNVVLTQAAGQTVTVGYTVSGGTATPGEDYILSNGTLTFPAGQTLRTIEIVVLDDEIEEGEETVVLWLGQPSGAKLGAVIQHTYTISDIASAPFPDSDTVGLWLFDEADYPHTTLTDASEYEKADLCLMDGGGIGRGVFGNALQMSGSDYAVCYAGFAGKVPEEELREADGTPSGLWGPTEGPGALLNGLAGSNWTVELWISIASGGSEMVLVDLGQAYDPGFELSYNGSAFVVKNHYAGVQATCPTGQVVGSWHHIAFTRSGSTVRHYLDGQQQASCTVVSISTQPIPNLQQPSDREHESRGFESMSFEQRRQNRFNFAIGGDRHKLRMMAGYADEMRVSRVVRYTGNFSPGSFSRNYGPGALPVSTADGLPILFNPNPVTLPLQFGARKHVFIDGAILDIKSGVSINMNQPYGKQAISGVSVDSSAWRPSVYDVDGVVYMAIPEGYGSSTGNTYLATSTNGVNFSMQGTIIEDAPLYGAFFRDLNPNVRPEEQYKLNAFVANRGMYMYISEDGLNWRRNETIQLALRSGGEGECFWDDQRGRYAGYIKRDSSFDDPECANTSGRVAPGFWTSEILKAWPFYKMVSPYFEGYPFPAVTCEGPVEFGITGATQVYRTRAIKYPWAPDVYMAFIWRYPGDDGARHVDLGVCRDGESWSYFATSYPGGPWYIPFGSAQEELSIYGLIRRGDEIWQYVDEGGAHGGGAARTYYRYRQRLDGFVSLNGTGSATTHPIVFTGDRLELNIASTGVSKVAFVGQPGQEIPGFGLADCDSISTDSVRHVVTWNGSSDIKSLSGIPVRLTFQLQGAKLYAFEIVDEPATGPCGLYDDAIIDGKDLKVLVENWLAAGTLADLNGDGTVNFKDYALLAAMWLDPC